MIMPNLKHSGAASYRFLANRFTMRCLCLGTVLLVFFDWSFDLGLIAFPFSKYARAFLLVVFLVYLLRTGVQFGKFKFPFDRILAFYAALNIIYSVVSPDMIGNLYYSLRIMFWLLGTVVAYRLALSGILSDKGLQKTIVATVFLGAAFTIFFMTRSGTEAGQNASAYLLLWCLPFLLMMKKSQLGKLVLVLAVFAILLTVKRGAMIALVLSIVAYGLTYLKLHGNFRVFIRGIRVVVLLAIVVAYALTTNWDAVQTRFQDTSGSGRSRMYTMLLNHYIQSDPMNLVFGFGINSVQKYTGYMYYGRIDTSGPYAHSDWLQMMHDFGLLGIGFLVWLHVKVLTLIRESYKKRHPFTPSLVMGYAILFLVNIYSGHLMSPNAIYFGLLLAFTAAKVPLDNPEKNY
ncbi:MAG: O-antigen ligase family protein [Desulfobulbaceae bacterium]|nr:O-antigen ligase family protein [Desulfobulbaceae bacterium]